MLIQKNGKHSNYVYNNNKPDKPIKHKKKNFSLKQSDLSIKNI